MLNLIVNALKFTQAGGKVDVKCVLKQRMKFVRGGDASKSDVNALNVSSFQNFRPASRLTDAGTPRLVPPREFFILVSITDTGIGISRED